MNCIISCGAAIIKRERILLCKRSNEEKHYPSYWGVVGGKKNPNESEEECIVRETNEEIGLTFRPTKLFKTYNKEKENIIFLSHIFLGEISGEIHNNEKEISTVEWFEYDEAINLHLAFSNSRVIEDLHKEGYI